MAPATLSIKKNILFGLSGNLVFALTQWGILAVVARLGAPEQVGAITVATALVTPIFFLSAMSMRDGHAVDDLTEFTRQDYFALRLATSLMAMGLILVLLGTWYGDRSGLIQTAILAFMLVKFVGTQSNMNYGVFQRAQRLDFVSASFAARGLMGLAGFAAVFATTGILWAAFLAEAVLWAAAIWLVDRRFLARLDVSDRLPRLREIAPARLFRLFLWMLPLGLAGFLVNATASAPRLVLEAHVDLQTVGVFGAIAYVQTALAMISNALGSASAARLRGCVRTGRRRRFAVLSAKLILLALLIGIALVGVVALAGPQILTLLYGSAYADGGLFLLVICATALQIAAAPLQFALIAGHAYWRRLGVNAATFALTLSAALLLVPDLGAPGAGWALIIGATTRLVLLLFFFLRLVITIAPPPDTLAPAGDPAE